MKLVLISPHYAPEFEGGTELVARAQAEALARRGHDLHVVSGSEEAHLGQDRHERVVGGLRVTFLRRLGSENYDLGLLRPRLTSLLEELCADADLVHVHHWSTLTGDLIRSLGERRPVVVSLHDLFVSCPRFFRVPHAAQAHCPTTGWDVQSCITCVRPDAGGLASEALGRGLEARHEAFQAELDAAARVLVPSQAHLDMLARFLRLPADTTVVPHGLCTQVGQLEPLHIPPAFTPRTPLRVLFLGHRSRVKGVLELVDALAGLEPQERSAVRLCMLGSEVEPGIDAELRARANGLSMDLGAGYESRDLASSLQAAGGAHLAALPSQVSESYGLVTDEAMGLGLPVWVSDRGAPRERVGQSGKVLPAQDALAWRSAFRELLANPDKLKEARRALPISARSADNAALDLEQIYRQILSAR